MEKVCLCSDTLLEFWLWKVINRLRSTYNGSLDKLDPYPAGLMEATPDSIGPLFTAVILDQFLRIRDGDRFWFENEENKWVLTMLLTIWWWACVTDHMVISIWSRAPSWWPNVDYHTVCDRLLSIIKWWTIINWLMWRWYADDDMLLTWVLVVSRYISYPIVHRACDYQGLFGVLWVHTAWYKNCVAKKNSQ